jgi:HEPN domain-containing protein
MKNDVSARALIEDAKIIFEEARLSFEKGHWHRVMRKCQESAELSVKGIFKYIGIEYPKVHQMGSVIKKEIPGRKILAKDEIDRLSGISDSLALDREASFYGADDGRPASGLFGGEDAREALEQAEWVIAMAEKVTGAKVEGGPR